MAAPGTEFTDSISGAIAILKGNGAQFTGTGLELPGTTNGNQPGNSIAAYVDLPNGIVSSRTDLTVEIWAKPLSSRPWQRLFDFGTTGQFGDGGTPGEWTGAHAPGATTVRDGIALAIQRDGGLGAQRLQAARNNVVAKIDTELPEAPGEQVHHVVTYASGVGAFPEGGRITWYRNGVLAGFVDFPHPLSAIKDANNWLGRAQDTSISNANVLYNEVRIYDHASSPSEVLERFQSGPGNGLRYRWSFDGTADAVASGTVWRDRVAGASAIVRGIGATANGTALTLPGTTSGSVPEANVSAYVDLPNGILSSLQNVTVEAWVTVLARRSWQRLFSFGSVRTGDGLGATGEWTGQGTTVFNGSSYDELALALDGNTGGEGQTLFARSGYDGLVGYNLSKTSTGATPLSVKSHYVMTYEKGVGTLKSHGGRLSWYRNGVLISTLDVPFELASISDVNNWLGRSLNASNSQAKIALDEFRIYSFAFTPSDVIANRDRGPEAVSEPVAMPDSVTMQRGQKALLSVLKNDRGPLTPQTVVLVSPPSAGTAKVGADGAILYTNTQTGAAGDTFSYRVAGPGGLSNTTPVTVTFSEALRITNPALEMPASPPATAFQLVDALPGVTFTEPICLATVPGDNRRLFVGERMAKIQLVPDVTAAQPKKQLFLDLHQVVAGRTPTETLANWVLGENGLLGLAFHPQHATNGYFYVAYTVRIGGIHYQRISRFRRSTGDPNVADPASELILLQQLDEGFNHNGGDLHFGPDGYLYYAAGDEDNPNDYRNNSQRIHLDFFAGIFRIDVDKKPGNLEPNAHAAIPTDDGIARFSVPIDNPFVHTSLGGTWDGKYNDVPVSLPAVRMEFWATGLRHPWRMSFDSQTGELWAGDVGQGTYEEVNLIVKGGNYGWVYREGAHSFRTAPEGFTSIDPVYEYVHTGISGGDAQFKGNSVCGGYVYRGDRFPALHGHYVFCDSVSGHVWSRNPTTGAVARLTGAAGAYGGLVSMGVDPSTKDLLFCDYINGRILRLTTAASATSFPSTLSATGFFADLTDLSPSPGLLPYEPNLAFWSDHAIKRRWFTIPNAYGRMTWARDANWTFPFGMLWVKHFDLELERGNPATKRRIETRVLVKTNPSAYGVSYRWNDAQTDAVLVPDEGAEFNIDVVENGVAKTQRWSIPSRTSCLTCHTPQAGGPLSFTTRQLNRTANIHGFLGNQLDLLREGGFFTNTPESPNVLPRHVRPDETFYPLETRVRSYLAVNCAYCHREDGTVAGANWDGSPQLPLARTGLINGVAVNNGGNPANKYVVPGDAAHSIVYNRVAVQNGFTRMPPLGSNELDQSAIALLQQWIASDLPTRQDYAGWRQQHFGSASSPEGDPAQNPDSDSATNEGEFLSGTNPLDGGSALHPQITTTGGGSSVTFSVPATRSFLVETSDDLQTWKLWDVPGNNGVGGPAGTITLTGPSSGDSQFFRVRIWEN
jgi:glucose/arabinose dehydrogenase